MSALENRLTLHRFILREFGYDDMPTLLNRLRDVSSGFDANGESEYAKAMSYLNSERARVGLEELREYDANIATHSRKLHMTEGHGRTWKLHQYLALLFTERYLHRYFDGPEQLRDDLNSAKGQGRLTRSMPDYTLDDLCTIAFQSATGSGKTLIMHAHILQYLHYLRQTGKRLNNAILLTPNEQMSLQHERELRDSGLQARLFSSDSQSEVFSPIEIIDLNKLAEKKGVKRVAVQDFGENNLVLVDEGHLGASGKVWRERREELARGGFTFEYSATFNQVTGANTEEGRRLRDAYGKCLLFDYSYRQFHGDGYGKDYAILNLPGGMQDENRDSYLLGCLLTFYQQCRIWQDKGADWAEFNLAKPLWVFLGKTVTGGRSRADKETKSDVAVILEFLGRVLARPDKTRSIIKTLLGGKSGLTDDAGNDFFAGRFDYLKKKYPNDLNAEECQALYADVCQTLFHGQGQLHVVYLTTGEGEMHLRCADNPVFGVVNVGDSAALYKMLSEGTYPDLHIERESGFVEKLFENVDRPDSTVNIVIGARRFIAGWNSWRVSTMGLMHVGVGEGPEIIQMFGRGVRLKGWNMSLKRHRRIEAELPESSDQLMELERLYIFGLRANYMQTFRDLLSREGIRAEQHIVSLPVTWNFARNTDLKMLRLKPDRKYEYSDDRPVLPAPGDEKFQVVTLNLYSQLQSTTSTEIDSERETGRNSVKLERQHTTLFNRIRIYDKLLARKQQKRWYNLTIEPETVDRLLENSDWYSLYAPPERLNVTNYRQMHALEDIAVDLITEYADRFWRHRRRQWEHENIEVVALDKDDPNNIRKYELSVDATRADLIKAVQDLVECARTQDFYSLKLGVIMVDVHAYKPLLHAHPPSVHGKDQYKITVQPVPLDQNERKVVYGLVELAESNDSCLQNNDLFLIRNQTRGRGVSFFDDSGYYPDFIIWLKNEDVQHVVFLDPKGISRLGSRERRKVELHKNIKETEARLRNDNPDLRLHAYVLSVTAPEQIDDGRRPAGDWKEDGVYFMNESDCLKQVVEHVLGQEPAAQNQVS